LKYGSLDGCVSFSKSNEVIDQLVSATFGALNLKEHFIDVGENPQLTAVYGPADVQCHVGLDNRIYFTNCQRVLPAEPPAK
jgi:hypothetical protein